MTTCSKIGLLGAFLMALAAEPGRAETLGVGSSAPRLDVKSFVQGAPVSEFEPGKSYVVEFWATWCGPCKTSIPHLNALQKKYPGITFIGVSIWEDDQAKVEPFVKEMGDAMAYRVAIDNVPEKGKASDGAMAKSWMTAAEQGGIPAAFIVNKEGKIAWIGHPMEMDKTLEKIADGSFDLNAVVEETRKERELEARLTKAKSAIKSAMRSGDPKALVAAIDEAAVDVPESIAKFGPMKLNALIKLEEHDKALEYAKTLAKSALGNDAQGLNEIAWTIVDPDAGIKPSAKLNEFALETARRADEKAAGKDAGIADTLAKAYFDSGNAAKAVETQERAIKLAKGTALEAQIDDLKDRLEKYKRAAK
jgi:thiol-disulfide isomerase/thioredoxin